jgi:hypothetical protein
MSAIIEFTEKNEKLGEKLAGLGYEISLAVKEKGNVKSLAVRYTGKEDKKVREIYKELQNIKGIEVIAASVRPEECERLLKAHLP